MKILFVVFIESIVMNYYASLRIQIIIVLIFIFSRFWFESIIRGTAMSLTLVYRYRGKYSLSLLKAVSMGHVVTTVKSKH